MQDIVTKFGYGYIVVRTCNFMTRITNGGTETVIKHYGARQNTHMIGCNLASKNVSYDGFTLLLASWYIPHDSCGESMSVIFRTLETVRVGIYRQIHARPTVNFDS